MLRIKSIQLYDLKTSSYDSRRIMSHLGQQPIRKPLLPEAPRTKSLRYFVYSFHSLYFMDFNFWILVYDFIFGSPIFEFRIFFQKKNTLFFHDFFFFKKKLYFSFMFSYIPAPIMARDIIRSDSL